MAKRKQIQIYFGGEDSEELFEYAKKRANGKPKQYLMSLIRADMEKKGAGNVRG